MRLRANSPAATSRTSDTAICVTTSMRRRRTRPAPCAGPPVDFRAGSGSIRPARSAGASPNTNAVRTETTNVKARTRMSGLVSIDSDRGPDAIAARAALAHRASSSPAMPPAVARSSDSASAWRTTRMRPAPIARHTAVSRRRASARASIKFATFAQAMISTSPTSPMRTMSGAESSPRNLADPVAASAITSRLSSTLFLNSGLSVPLATSSRTRS